VVTFVDLELVEQTPGVALVGLIGHPAATDQVVEAGLEKATAALNQLCSASGQPELVPVAAALPPRRLQKPLLSEDGHHPASGGFALAEPVRDVPLAAVTLPDREQSEEPRVGGSFLTAKEVIGRTV